MTFEHDPLQQRSIRRVYDLGLTGGMSTNPSHLGLTLDGPLEVDNEAVKIFLHRRSFSWLG